MSLSFKFIPLTFLNDENEIKRQIRNTIILKYFFERNSETVHLEDLITGTQYGYNASALVQGRNKFLRISDITDGKVNWDTVPYCNCIDEETYLLFPNDILIARTGGTTGKSFLISEPPALSIYAGYLIRIRANEDTNPDYLNLFLNSYVYWSQIVSLNEDNFRPSVNANKLKKLVLPKCDTKAQNDAVEISNGELISGYDDLYLLIEETLLKYEKLREIQIEKQNQISLYKQLKQSFLLEASQGKLTDKWREENNNIESASILFEKNSEKRKKQSEKKLKSEEKSLKSDIDTIYPFEIPEKWEYVKFKDVCDFQIGKTPPTKEMDYWVKGEYSWLSIADMNDFGIIQKTQKKITKKAVNNVFNYIPICPPETLLMSFKLTVGKISISKIPLYHNEAIISIFPFEGIERDYLFYFLPLFINLSVGKKVLMGKTFNSESLKNIVIAIPPTIEQKRIIHEVELLLSKLKQLEDEIISSELKSHKLIHAVLQEAFEIKNSTDSLDSLFEDVNYNLYVAIIHKQIENRLRINYGEVATQKTVFNINAFTDQKIPYNFINSNHGTFSPQLKEDLGKNVYLTKDKKGNGEVFIVNPSKEKEVLDALSNPKNKQFVRAVNEVLDIYELPFINKETDKIELLNTVAKLIIDYKTSDLDKIYKAMQDWEIKQIGFKSKAEKFSKKDTQKMIELIENLNLINKLF